MTGHRARNSGATTLLFGWVFLLLGVGAPNIERVVHFNLHNTGCEKTHYRSGGPIAAFVLAAVGIRGDNHQDGGGDKTATDHGVSHIHDRTPS
jgi:hypothetical protein